MDRCILDSPRRTGRSPCCRKKWYKTGGTIVVRFSQCQAGEITTAQQLSGGLAAKIVSLVRTGRRRTARLTSVRFALVGGSPVHVPRRSHQVEVPFILLPCLERRIARCDFLHEPQHRSCVPARLCISPRPRTRKHIRRTADDILPRQACTQCKRHYVEARIALACGELRERGAPRRWKCADAERGRWLRLTMMR